LVVKNKGQYHFFDNEDDAKAAQKKHGGTIEKVRGRMGNDFYILRGANILKDSMKKLNSTKHEEFKHICHL
jgi:hypothetical protein